LSQAEQRGQVLFNASCQACHGGLQGNRIINRPVHDELFVVLQPNGNVLFTQVDLPDGSVTSIPVPDARPESEFVNIGMSYISYFGQLGLLPDLFNASVTLPSYRLRFYTDGTRRQQLMDLPPVAVTASGDPFDPDPPLDENGAPVAGPNFGPQAFSTDPGRALVTGNPSDFETFDVPQLRGIAQTAPYFHDNSHATLADVVDTYSRFILPVIPPLNLPGVNPPELPGFPAEALSPDQKTDLIAFLQRL
jgi:hypothetical protein